MKTVSGFFYIILHPCVKWEKEEIHADRTAKQNVDYGGNNDDERRSKTEFDCVRN